MKKAVVILSILSALMIFTGIRNRAAAKMQGSSEAVSISASIGTGITYQGYLEDSGGPVTDDCDIQFSVYDSAGGSNQISTIQTHTNVPVENGYFSVQDLDFGSGVFQGDARYLKIAVRCPAGSGGYTTLNPLQPITPAPYALALPGLWTQAKSPSPNLIGGYSGNQVASNVWGATIGGGGSEGWGPNTVTDHFSTISGGVNNQVGNNIGAIDTTDLATIGGGGDNAALGWASTIGGGISNVITNTANAATIGGGTNNTIIGNFHATIGGGANNIASGFWNTTVAGGSDNTASESEATVGGGAENTASGVFSTLSGGYQNAADGWGASVPGGVGNHAIGDSSFAAGYKAMALHNGAFVWADSTGTPYTSTVENQFSVRATGGVNFETGGAAFLINGASPGSYANVVVVARSGGDYISIQSALGDITDASESNPYLVWVAPGVYSETVTMKEYVSLQGAGQGTTVITGTVSNNSWPPNEATVVLSSYSSLRDLTVVTSGAGLYNIALMARGGITQTHAADVTTISLGTENDNIGIYISGTDTGVVLEHITAIGKNGSEYNYGLRIDSGAVVTLYGGSYTGRGGYYAYGIYIGGSGTIVEGSAVLALGEESDYNRGLATFAGAQTTLHGGSFTGRGGIQSYGISIGGNGAILEASNIIALGKEASNNNFGLLVGNDVADVANVTQSTLEGATKSIYSDGGTVTFSNGRLIGGPVSGTVTCVLVSRGTSVSTGGSCP